MKAAETIAAAIAKLKEMVALPELAQASDDPGTLVINGGDWAGEMMHPRAAYDVVTLHRTIDPMLAILQRDIEIRARYSEDGFPLEAWESAVERAGDLDLARAILGDAAE